MKAHNGCPWNECVDVVARAVAEDILIAPQFSDLWKEVINDETDRNAIGWLWFRERLEAHPQPDILCSPTDIVMKLPEVPHANFGSQLTINNVWKQWAHGDSPVEEKAAIRVVSANVLSLFAGKGDKLAQGHYVSSRMEELQWQCKNAGADMETRHRAGHYFSCEHYHVLSGAATVKGHGGTQIWIAKTLQCGLTITSEHLRTVYQDSQLLIACLQHPAIRLVIVTAHAPTSDKDIEAGQWWNQVTMKLKLCPKWPVIGLFDANSRVGSKVSPSVGDHGGSQENVAGAMFHEWLLQHEMWLPSTFATSHHGDHHTWYHATGASARLDYVVLSKCFKDLEVQSWVSKDIDLSLQRVDHVPVCCSLKVQMQASNGSFTPKQQKQQNGRGEPDNINFASIPWKLNVHEHADQLDVTLRTLQEDSRQARRLRKQHLTDPTWTLIKAKRNCWRQILLMRSHLRQGFLREVWSAWRHQVRPDQYKPTLYSFQAWLRWSDFETARWLYLHKHFATLAAKAVREDDRGYYEDLAKRAGDTDTHHGLQKLWGEVAAMLPKAQNRRRNNTTAQQPPLEEMQRHFDQLEAGEPMEFADLAADCLRQQLLHQTHATCSFQLSALPSRLTMERLCLRTIPGKAAGLDRVNPNIVRQQAPIVGKALFELVMKAWMTGSEPISWKGGLQIALWKGKGSKQTPASYRGIVLLSALAKRWHALLRQQLLPHVMQQKLDTQYGGFPGQQPGFATCTIRSISNIAHANGLSDACLFLDLRSAFHHLIRQAAWNFGETTFTPTLCEALGNEGIDAAALQARVRGGQHYGVLPLPSHLNNLLVDLHTSTWYTLKGSSEPSATHRGTRPGSPFADLGFNAFMSQVMIIIREFLWQQADLTSAMQSVNLEPVVIGWVDDLAIPILSTNAEALLNTIKTVTEGVVRIMWEAGLQINLGKGKTECVATFRGRKAPAVRSQTFVNDKGQIGIEIPQDGNARLHLVGQYVHLGTCFGQGLHFGGEINRRIGAATTTFRQLAKPLFANRRISIPTRLQLLEALVCSKLMYNSGVWPQLTGRQHQKLEHTIIGWQRRIINQGFWSEDLVRDEVLQRRWQLPTLAVRLAVARIRFALAASRKPLETTWRLIGLEFEGCSRSWCQLLLPALQWLVDVIPKAQFFDVRCEDLNFQQITEWLQSEHRPHKGMIKRALQKHLLQERIIQEVRDGYEEVRNIFQGLGLYKPALEVQEGSAPNFTCEVCDMKFGNAQKLQVHRWSKHGLVSVERQFVFGKVCASCGVNFWTPQRVQQHLRYSRLASDGCFERLRRYKAPLTSPVQFEIPDDLKHIHRLPAVQAQLPMDTDGPTRFDIEIGREKEEWQQEWTSLGLPLDRPDDLWDQTCKWFSEATLAWGQRDSAEILDLFDYWAQAMEDLQRETSCEDTMAMWLTTEWLQHELPTVIQEWEDPDDLQKADFQAYDLITAMPIYKLLLRKERLGRREPRAPYLLPATVAAPRPARGLGITSHYFAQNEFLMDVLTPELTQPAIDPKLTVVVGPRGQHIIIIVHLFAGRRRNDDLHSWIDRISAQWLPGFETWILSFDTAIHSTLGNLLGKNFARLIQVAKTGAIAASASGPPCETYSPARHLPPPSDSCLRWPRPLRSKQRLWGIADRSLRELEQLRTGNLLYFNCNILEFHVSLRGGVSLLEHPADPNEEGKCSSWQSCLHQHYAKSVINTKPVRINQWRYGAPTVKPTVIRVMNATRADRELHQHYVEGLEKPSAKLGGVNSQGEFHTAAAKEYPAAMSRALATSIVKELAIKLKRGYHCIDCKDLGANYDWLLEVKKVCATIRADACMRPDYQRQS